jgi:hypothetical protein
MVLGYEIFCEPYRSPSRDLSLLPNTGILEIGRLPDTGSTRGVENWNW